MTPSHLLIKGSPQPVGLASGRCTERYKKQNTSLSANDALSSEKGRAMVHTHTTHKEQEKSKVRISKMFKVH